MIAIMSMTLIDHLRRLSYAKRRFAAGTFLFQLDDPVTVFHVIEEGWVHLVRFQPEGRRLTLQRFGPGSLLAEASLFSDCYHCDALAVSAGSSLCVRRSAIEAAWDQDPSFARAWAAHLAGEIRATRMRAEILALRTVSERLDAWIAVQDQVLPQKGDWRTVAMELNVSPEALYRELARRRRRTGCAIDRAT